MDYYIYKSIDFFFESLTYINDFYNNYMCSTEERILHSTYDIETDTITYQYKIEDKVYTLKIDRTTSHDIKALISDFKYQPIDDKILNAILNGEDITEQLNELCGPSGCHLAVSPMKISYITYKPVESLIIIDDLCIEHTFSYDDDFMVLD